MESLPVGVLAALVGAIGGITLGLAVRVGDFCTLGAIESAVYGENPRRLRQWGITLGVAIIGTFLLAEFSSFNFADTISYSTKWNPLASIFGGLVFGYGMAYAGNCGFSALARIGGGDLRALVVVIVTAIFSAFTLGGPLAALRERVFHTNDATANQGIAHLMADYTSIPVLVIAIVIGLGFLVWGMMHVDIRRSPNTTFWAAAVGLAVISSWWGTSYLAETSLGETSVQAHSFTAPLGRTMIYTMTSSAGGINFAVGSVFGVIVGGFLGSLFKGSFRWEACEDARELGRQMMGAALMGVGGIIALGCTIGQGVSAFSTLSYSAPVTLAAIAVGAVIGLRRLVSGFQPE